MPSDGSGRGRARRLLTGNVLWLSLVSLLNDTASEMIFPLLPVFLVSVLGAGPAFLGLLEGVAETTASFVKLAGGWLSDRIRRRRALVLWGYGVAVVARPLVALATLPWHVLVLRFSDRVGKGVRTAPRDALLAESVEAGRRGRAFGIHRAADHLGAALGPLLATGLLLLWPGRLRWVFGLALVPGLVALAVLTRVREVGPGGAESAAAGSRPELPDLRLRDLGRGFTAFLGVLVLFTLGNASDAFLILRAQGLGVGVAWIPVLWGAFHVSKMGWNVVGGWIADRSGPGPAIVAGWLVYAVTYAGFALATDAWHAWGLFLVYGLFYGLTEAPEKVLVAALAPPALRARAFGAYHFAVGLAALPASLLFGLVWEAWGADVAFFLGGGLALVAAVLLPLSLRAARGGTRPGA